MFRKKNKNIQTEADASGDKALKSSKGPKSAKSKKKKKIIIIGVIVLIVAAALALPGLLGSGEMPSQVSVGSVERMDLEQTVSVNGIISGSQFAEVVSSLNYEIISILVEEGDRVKKDQVLAVLDGEALQDEYRKAVKALEESRFNYEASKRLYEEGAISQAEYIRAKNAYENDQITVNSFDISEKTNIRSPIDGTVTRVNVSLGRYANDTEDNKPMFVIEDLDQLKMDVKVSEYDIGKIKVGQTVTITADVLGKDRVTGTVSRISPTGELKDPASKEMVIPVRINVDQNEKLIAGVTAKAKILIESRSQVLTVPIDAVLEDPDTGESYVLAVEGTAVKKVTFEPGIEGDFHLEVLSGSLSEGDQVVLNPTFDLTDGMEVLVLPAQ
ncbi:MAG: efflux RND transporter periplasmic adaptor subunit [Anaerovoracaceae bacterium]|jgi:HlyD family secretion protein